MPIVIIFIVLVAAVLIIQNVRIVPQANAYIVEKLGAYKETLGVGIHILTPFFDRVAKKVSLKEQVIDFPPQSVITKDNVTMKVDTVIYFQITDPKLFTYAVDSPLIALENLTATTLRNIIGSLELDETLTSRDVINDRMQGTLDTATDPWGIKVKRVEIKDIQPPKGILESMEKQMKAERDRRETLLEAEGHKQSVVMRAEGDKQAKILAAEAERDAKIALAEGEAMSRKLVYEAEAEGIEALNRAGASETVLTLKKIDALKELGKGKATKIVLPTELASLGSTLQFAGEMLKNDGHSDLNESDNVDEESNNLNCGNVDVCCDDKKRRDNIYATEDKMLYEFEKNSDKSR